MRHGKGASLSSAEGALERCEFEMRPVGDRVDLTVHCKSCDGKASLLERGCRNGILGILLEEPIPDSIILAGFVETLYEDVAVELVQKLTDTLRAVIGFGKRRPGDDSERCFNCKKGPAYVFNRIERAFKKSLPAFSREVKLQSSGLSANRDSCKRCLESTKSDLRSLSIGLDELRSWILGRAFKISSVGRKEETALIEPRSLVTGMKRVLSENSSVRPCFSSSWVTSNRESGSDLITAYKVGDEEVGLQYLKDKGDCVYCISPLEYQLPLSHVKLIHLVLEELMDHHPENVSLESLEQTRGYIIRQAEELIPELASKHEILLGSNREEELENGKTVAEIVAKYTSGLGVMEVLLRDNHVQDVYVDAPASSSHVHVVISGVDDERMGTKLATNIRLGEDAAESLLSKFRLESGRPFSESMPVLEHNLPSFGTRVTVVGPPLSPNGIAIALRRHSTRPWTLLKLIANGTLTAEAAGLISFLIDGRSTILVAGSRGAGKSSLLGAMMLEFPQSQRIITIEDTLELPVSAMHELGFKIQSLYVQSSLGGKGQMTADEALRVSLRLGESVLVMGEVRGQEARTLYEAMRAGTAGSSVMGTFHADSARAVFERVVHDMGINAKSFTATDVVIVCGLTKPGGTQRERRRVVQIAEIVKEAEGDFRDLLLFNEMEDRLLSGDGESSRIHNIAKSWGMRAQDAIGNIEVRSRMREAIVDFALKEDRPSLLEAGFVIRSNVAFRQLIEKHHSSGAIDCGGVLREWKEWFNKVAGYA
jgi:type IV secretory pathway ATPase VirB11/archaellum biosynthesis ATPase